MTYRFSADEAAGRGTVAGSMVGKGHGPGAIAVTVSRLAAEAEVAAGGDFLAQAAKIGAQFVVPDQAPFAILESAAEAEGHLLLDCVGKAHGLDFPAEPLPGGPGGVPG